MIFISHNVFWFQGKPTPPPHDRIVNLEIFENLMALYQSYQVNVLLLQEIQSEEVARKIADALQMNYYYVPGEELQPYGVVALWETGLNCQVITTDIHKYFQRACQMIKINDFFTVANIHLPSDAQLETAEAYQKRKQEMEVLLNAGIAIDMLAGDFNEEPNDELAIYLQSNGYLDTFQHAHGDCTVSTTGNLRGDFFRIHEKYDHKVKEFHIHNLKVEDKKTSTGKYWSDHFPLILDLDL